MKHIVSFSGGKDSTAMLLRMIELNMPIDQIVFADTLLEFPEMYEWIAKIEKMIGRKITVLKPKSTWDDWFYGKITRGPNKGKMRGFPKGMSPCWWSRECKQEPLSKMKTPDIVSYIGIAKDEKHRAESKMYLKTPHRFPLIEWGWTEADCVAYLRSKGLEHPLYKHFKRTGCWLCPKQKNEALVSLYNHYPELYEKLKQYEADSPHEFKYAGFSLEKFEKKYGLSRNQRKL